MSEFDIYKDNKTSTTDNSVPFYLQKPQKTQQKTKIEGVFNKKSHPQSGFQPKGLTVESQQSSSYVKAPENHSRICPELRLDNNGKIDISQFNTNELRKKYSRNLFTIKEEGRTTTIIDKKTNRPSIIIQKGGRSGYLYTTCGKDGKPTQGFYINKSNSIAMKIDEHNHKIYSYTDNGKLQSITQNFADGSRKELRFDANEKLSSSMVFPKNSSRASEEIKFSNGKPWEKTTFDAKGFAKQEFPLVKDLVADLSETTLGIPTPKKSLRDNILKRLTNENIHTIMGQYKKETGRSLHFDLSKKCNGELRTKLLTHFEKCYINGADPLAAGKSLAGNLKKDFISGNTEDIIRHVKMINKDNLPYVLTFYKNKDVEDRYNFKNNLSKHLRKFLPDKAVKEISEKLGDNLITVSGLLESIAYRTTLTDNERKALKNHIIKTAVAYSNGKTNPSIAKDINRHLNNYNKLEVDLLRSANKGDVRIPNKDKTQIPANGKFDNYIKQGRTGDCWLLAGMNSAISRPKYKKELESLIKLDPKTGDAVVTLKGVGLKYKVTKEEIKNGREFSTGDNDAKIIEIAFDKYMKARAYRRGDSEYFIDEDDGKIANIDVNGNNSTFAISVLFGVGKGKFNDNINAKTENFNNKNKLYTFGIPRRNGIKVIKGVAKNSKGEHVDLETKHAYSVVGSSKNDLFVKNPWNSEEILTIARKDFPKLHTTIQSYESV